MSTRVEERESETRANDEHQRVMSGRGEARRAEARHGGQRRGTASTGNGEHRDRVGKTSPEPPRIKASTQPKKKSPEQSGCSRHHRTWSIPRHRNDTARHDTVPATTTHQRRNDTTPVRHNTTKNKSPVTSKSNHKPCGDHPSFVRKERKRVPVSHARQEVRQATERNPRGIAPSFSFERCERERWARRCGVQGRAGSMKPLNNGRNGFVENVWERRLDDY